MLKNEPDPDSGYYEMTARTHNLLRVMEAVRAAEGGEAVDALYTEYGRRIMHDHDFNFEVADALDAVGLDSSHAAAFEDAAWDDLIRAEMDEGLALTGDDVGTPIIAFDTPDGERVGLFGPVISQRLDREPALALWDSFVTLATTPGFWELKRIRTESPEFG
ncbi:MAG: disulfide bond formation protein DsbA, partial [Acidimicrobiia bacterium]|nr:disulfide bond formation protein DsbA [Acidimicrobiia bacterium]